MYEDFHILIDDPASRLSLGFDDYASALAEIASVSRPQFAIGIFGAWGAGKTTLMRAMKAEMAGRDDIVPIWFNAWRYEKEEHLIVPLLDTLREQVLEWSTRTGADPDATRSAGRLAGVLGRAARAILAGLTLKAGLPKVIEVSLDANRVATQWRTAADGDPSAAEPKSFYHAAFLALQSSVTEFLGSAVGAPGSRRRFVVFIDDIDRCLPNKALEVLESMKLFFDLEGFVFVVGLDQGIIERAVQHKYLTNVAGPDGGTATYISGTDYIKKIFQVQFTAPRVDQSQLVAYLDAVADAGGLPQSQRDDLTAHVAPQIANLAGSSSVNPREVKRLINAYTMQMKILERKLTGSGRSPSPSAVLALQIMSFRADWQAAYEALSNNPTEFVDSASDALREGTSIIAAGEEVVELPGSLLSFLQNEGAALLRVGDDLEVYVSALETARSTDPTIREIAQLLGRVRVALRSATPDDPGNALELVQELGSRLSRHVDTPDASGAGRRLLGLATNYPVTDPTLSVEDRRARYQSWLDQAGAELVAVAQTVTDLRRRAATAATSLS